MAKKINVELETSRGRRGGMSSLLLLAGAAAIGYYLSKPQNRKVVTDKMNDLGVGDAASRVADAASTGYQKVREAAAQGVGAAREAAKDSDLQGSMQDVKNAAQGAVRDVASETRDAVKDAAAKGQEAASTSGSAAKVDTQEMKENLSKALQDAQASKTQGSTGGASGASQEARNGVDATAADRKDK